MIELSKPVQDPAEAIQRADRRKPRAVSQRSSLSVSPNNF